MQDYSTMKKTKNYTIFKGKANQKTDHKMMAMLELVDQDSEVAIKFKDS